MRICDPVRVYLCVSRDSVGVEPARRRVMNSLGAAQYGEKT